jgi:hypothetical protein
MSSFDAWLERQPGEDAELADLRQAKTALGPAWPTGSAGWAAYATAIAGGGAAVPDKGKVLGSLERAYGRFAPGAERGGFWATIAGWVSNVYFWSLLLGAAFIFVLFSFALDEAMLVELAKVEQARGLITFLFAIATVGIALIIVLATFLSTGSGEDIEARYRMGKDVLALLIGVFGTIIGFYFGSELAASSTGAPTEASAPATAPGQ